MSGLLWLLLVSAALLLLGGWWQHRRDQQKLQNWIRQVEHAERSQGMTDQVCWNWDAMKKKRTKC